MRMYTGANLCQRQATQALCSAVLQRPGGALLLHSSMTHKGTHSPHSHTHTHAHSHTRLPTAQTVTRTRTHTHTRTHTCMHTHTHKRELHAPAGAEWGLRSLCSWPSAGASVRRCRAHPCPRSTSEPSGTAPRFGRTARTSRVGRRGVRGWAAAAHGPCDMALCAMCAPWQLADGIARQISYGFCASETLAKTRRHFQLCAHSLFF